MAGCSQLCTNTCKGLRAALIVGLACAVITLLFLVQQFGTGVIGTFFSPILFTWLLFYLRRALPSSRRSLDVHAIPRSCLQTMNLGQTHLCHAALSASLHNCTLSCS